jgi:hypothetical protein
LIFQASQQGLGKRQLTSRRPHVRRRCRGPRQGRQWRAEGRPYCRPLRHEDGKSPLFPTTANKRLLNRMLTPRVTGNGHLRPSLRQDRFPRCQGGRLCRQPGLDLQDCQVNLFGFEMLMKERTLSWIGWSDAVWILLTYPTL